ncbi:SORF3 [anatid alphaherpesvirus 1]|uniref:SORF-3 n=1 Tax=anatid alphaherpesvirus 1 TaxID=104388 RepID=A5A419_9ALPH|nr:SORF3 [Anatid alphaherpesvirus 1]AHD45989.1 SORF3 [BAC cloning vector pDEV-vac]QWQ49799.1 SORF3 [BAC cloning vector pDEV-CHa]ABP88842.1 SORF3 [Anatid alphaherpesvirus 1]ABS19579.1 SORF3 [Anatid alphaherpesvirus 1]ABV24952.1 SORF3 [Anatid alphaherpesvirus 1]
MAETNRLFAAAFNGIDTPRGRFWNPRMREDALVFWPRFVDEIVHGIKQCAEARERLASICISEPACGDNYDPNIDMWAQITLWSVYHLCEAISKRFSVDELALLGHRDLSCGGPWKFVFNEWDFRDSGKLRLVGPGLMAMFTAHMENWTAGLSTAPDMATMSVSTPCERMPTLITKVAMLCALEVARFIAVLVLPISDYRVPPGLPDDDAGRALRVCCATMQQRRLLGPELEPDARLDGEELYYRALVRTIMGIIDSRRETSFKLDKRIQFTQHPASRDLRNVYDWDQCRVKRVP